MRNYNSAWRRPWQYITPNQQFNIKIADFSRFEYISIPVMELPR